MPISLKQAWIQVVTADDYERHMAAIGQAEANARLLETFLRATALPASSRVLIAGAGPGQMFDYVAPAILSPYQTVFTDINADYLARLRARLDGSAIRFDTVLDDLETSRLTGPFDLAAVTLVLEHVDWRAAVTNLARLAPRLLTIIQKNPPEMDSAVTKARKVPPSIEVFHEAQPKLLDEAELAKELAALGLEESYRAWADVADGKRMLALGFSRPA